VKRVGGKRREEGSLDFRFMATLRKINKMTTVTC